MFSIHSIYRKIAGVALTAVALCAASCSDDLLYDDGLTQNADGTFGPFDLEIAIDSERGDNKTRGANFDTNGLQIKNVWIAMFDCTSGNLVAMNDTVFNPSDASGDHNNGSGLKAVLHSIMFGESTPTGYLVGVANFDGVVARDPETGEESSLYDALYNIKNIKDYKNICIDARSAERAMGDDNAPLMSGIWGTQHGNYTVNLSGVVYSDKVTGNDNEHTQIPLFDPVTKKVTAQTTLNNSKGMLHLRRLYSHINATVNFNDSYFTKVENPEVQIFNMPTYTFLQEHKTVENAYAYTNETWKNATHNASYYFPGSTTDTGVMRPGQTLESDNEAFVMNDADQLAFSGKKLTFGYWHYETKHWGQPENVKTINDRERLYGKSGIYSSLCHSEDQAFNNDAPYFVVRAYVETADGYSGNAEFVVHEGYCCSANGLASTDEAVRSLDFCTFRNTNYTYTVNIESINGFKMKVESEDLGGDGYYHGSGGEMWSTRSKDVDVPNTGETTHDIMIPAGKFYWCIREGNGTPYGIQLDDTYAHYAKYSAAYPSAVQAASGGSDAFYNNVTIDGEPLGKIDSFDVIGSHSLKFTGQASVNAYLYLLGIAESADGTASYYTVFCFNQNGTRLDDPRVSMPFAPQSGDVIVGIHNHTLEWPTVGGADAYTITLTQTGYSVTLKPGEQTTDSYGNKIELREEDGKLRFAMPYSNDRKGMLAAFQSYTASQNNNRVTANFTVTALNQTTGATSRTTTFSKTIANPYWDFNFKEWADGVATLTTTNVDITNGLENNQELTIRGLTMYTGTSNKMTYTLHGNYYTFRPNGSGTTGRLGFKFHAFAKGHINVWTASQNTNVSNVRNIKVTEPDNTGKNVERTIDNFNAAGTKAGSPAKSPNISITPVYDKDDTSFNNVYVYSGADFGFYRIQFVPED